MNRRHPTQSNSDLYIVMLPACWQHYTLHFTVLLVNHQPMERNVFVYYWSVHHTTDRQTDRQTDTDRHTCCNIYRLTSISYQEIL